MLYKNDLFDFEGQRMRLLYSNADIGVAWCIAINDSLAWPISIPLGLLSDVQRVEQTGHISAGHSASCIRKGDEAWHRLEPLIATDPQLLFDPTQRNQLILSHAEKIGCSPTTLRKDLRRFWTRGQTKAALMPDYSNSGRPASTSGDNNALVTAGRGSKPHAGHEPFQLTMSDLAWMREVVEGTYFADDRQSVVDTYNELIKRHYCHLDGNGTSFVNEPGERPSIRQFRYYLHTTFNLKVRLKKRHGRSDFERDHRKVLGSVLQACQGVGHVYEIDATIGDIFLVSHADRRSIVGKPTIYLIVDRKSRLIVGFYMGLEAASWSGAMQAVYSISENKQTLCERYGVHYDPQDWPAHEVLPQEFVADRGEMISHASTVVAEDLHITVTNLPSKRPDWKPLVECGFKLVHSSIRAVAPGYEPPRNVGKRQGKHYENDACLTVNELGKLLLEAIIKQNRSMMPRYPLSPKELTASVRPVPIDLWNHNIASRAGLLSRYEAATVRRALLPKAEAVVTEHGVEFGGCCYSFPQAISDAWFERARKSRFKVTVSYDSRLVDQIYVHALDGKSEPQLATLTERSRDYKGLCLDEVSYLEKLRKEIADSSEHHRLQLAVDYKRMAEPVTKGALAALKASGSKKSRSARKADTNAARLEELRVERNEVAVLQPPAGEPVSPVPAPHTPPQGASVPNARQDMLERVRRSMRS